MGCSGSSEHPVGRGRQRGPGEKTGTGEHYYRFEAQWSEIETSPELTAADKRRIAGARNNEYCARIKFLEQVPLLKTLPKDQYPLLAQACCHRVFSRGDVIVEQGGVGDAFFVIISGEAMVTVKNVKGKPEKVGKLRPGDYFGEQALVRDDTRAATVTASTDIATYEIKRVHFQKLGLTDRLQFASRHAVAGGVSRQASTNNPVRPATPKTPEEAMLLAEAITQNRNLQTIAAFDESLLQDFISMMWKEEVLAGQDMNRDREAHGDRFYVVQEGSFELLHDGQAVKHAQSAEMLAVRDHPRIVGKGDSFGELALLYLAPQALVVRARERSTVWVIDRETFKSITLHVSDSKLNEYVGYLDGVSVLSSLLVDEKREIAKALLEMQFHRGDCVIRQGEDGNNFYILFDGSVKIVKDGEELSRLSACPELQEAHYFGERALLADETRAATVVVTSPSARCLALDRDTFNLMLGPLKDIIQSNKDGVKGPRESKRPSMAGRRPSCGRRRWRPQAQHVSRVRIYRKDLVKVGLLGVGACSVVELYEHSLTKQSYAMKVVGKGFLLRAKLQDVILNEKDIFMRVNSPFIIKLFETYNGSQSLYFLLEAALGGELYTLYRRKDLHGSVRHGRYYLAGCVLALEHMHERKIIYRDLKPENTLLNSDGHLKLTDMGLAKFVIGKTYSTCGTPDYFAPEMINSRGHNCALDWWSLGIFLFELMTGRTPFASHFPMQIYRKVQKGIHKVRFPSKCQGDVASLVRNLLVNDPSGRLPMKSGGVENIKNHKWYTGFSWDLMARLELEPPYMPVVLDNKDLSNFSARPEDVPKQCTYYDPGTGWDKDFATV